METIDVLFVGENEHLVIERFIGRALTIEEIGSIKPEAFQSAVNGIQYRLVKIPRGWSVHPNKKIDQFFDTCSCAAFVINLCTCNQPSVLDPTKNQITMAFDTINKFASLDFMANMAFCVIFLTPNNLDSLVENSALAPYTDDAVNGQAAMQKLCSYAKELIKTSSKNTIYTHIIQCEPNNVRNLLVAGLKDIILEKALGLMKND